MKIKLKPLKDQVIVITGATSGIGLATVLEAAQQGAKLVLTARNEDELRNITQKLQKKGCQVAYKAADIANDIEVQRVADLAIERYGRMDTWINNAGVSIYGRLVDVPLADKRRVFETNFWGVVHGCKAAVKHMRKQGGAIINIGSETSEHAIPLQGIYSASKHAVKAYTQVLRMELEQEKAPISLTLIKPGAINTPFTAHAKNYMEKDPELPPPVYAPEVVARAILACAEKPVASLFVGGSGVTMSVLQKLFPRMTEIINELVFFRKQKATMPKHRDEALNDKPKREGEVYGDSPYRMHHTSLYTNAALHPITTGIIAAGVGTLTYKGVQRFQSRRRAAA